MSQEAVADSGDDVRDGYKQVQLGPKIVDIPEEWDYVYFSDAIGFNPRYKKPDDGTFDFVPMDAVSEEEQRITYFTKREKDDCTTTWLKNKDTIYAKITPCAENGKIAFVGNVDTEIASGSTEFVVFHPKEGETDPRFVFYLSNMPQFRSVTISLMEGSTNRQRIPNDIFKENLRIPLPSLSEQKRIAEILSMVDKEIRQTEELIDKSRELKRGLVQDLIFSGIEREDTKQIYIGPKPVEIAESWDTKQIGELTTTVQYGCSESLSQEGEYPMFRMNNIEDGRMVAEPMKYVDLDEETAEKYRVEQDDILFNRTNSIDLVGKAGIFDLDEEFVFASYLIRIQTNDQMNPWFLNYFINSGIGQDVMFSIATRGASQANINATNLKNVKVPVPPREEQDEIVKRIQTVEEKIDKEQQKKERLQELKRGLMQDLLTGKVRVDPDNATEEE